jgi:hypothetical protein
MNLINNYMSNNMSIKNNETQTQTLQEQNLLDIYYIIDYPEEIDTELMEKYFKVYLNVNLSKSKLSINIFQKIEAYPKELCYTEDVIKNGLYSFNKMFNDLKLKSKNETWFFYLSNGDIDNQLKYKNIDVILLNKDLSKKECLYNINKININILKSFLKDDKLNKLTKIFKNNLDTLLSSKELLKYDKLN